MKFVEYLHLGILKLYINNTPVIKRRDYHAGLLRAVEISIDEREHKVSHMW